MIVVNSKTLRVKVDTPLLSRSNIGARAYLIDNSFTFSIHKEDELGVSYGYNQCKIYGMVCCDCGSSILFTGQSYYDHNDMVIVTACDCARGGIILEKAR